MAGFWFFFGFWKRFLIERVGVVEDEVTVEVEGGR